MSVLDHCDRQQDRFAILDALPVDKYDLVLEQRERLHSNYGALYFPWLQMYQESPPQNKMIPPCGHVAGMYARVDEQYGIHKAPANEILHDVFDLQHCATIAGQGQLNARNVNCICAFPGRGIRVWGARTLTDDASEKYVNVRRLVISVKRWIEQHLAWVSFEPNTPKLWARINRELTSYCNILHQNGALKGKTSDEAFFIKCNAETNSQEAQLQGTVVTEIGLAALMPYEFIAVHVIWSPGEVVVTRLSSFPSSTLEA